MSTLGKTTRSAANDVDPFPGDGGAGTGGKIDKCIWTKKDAGDKENEPEDDADPSAGSAPAPKPSLERTKSKMEDGSNRVINLTQVATFPIGSQVRTKAAKSKREYDGHRGEIQALMNNKARVLLMEGPKKGSTL